MHSSDALLHPHPRYVHAFREAAAMWAKGGFEFEPCTFPHRQVSLRAPYYFHERDIVGRIRKQAGFESMRELRESLSNTRIRRDEYIDDRRYQAGMTNELFGVCVTRIKWEGSLRFLRASSSENISFPTLTF